MKEKTFKELVKAAKRELNNSYKECVKSIAINNIKDPPYVMNIGDRVVWGAWKWSVILEIMENGKFYKVLSITPNIKYGKYEGEQVNLDYKLWTNIRPYKDMKKYDNIEILQENNDIRFSYQQRDINSIFNLFYYSNSGLDLNPSYQRGFVWDEEQKVALIDSIFKNIDIGKFTIIRRNFSEELNHYYEVLDGKQRIQALLDFYECRFKYKGKTFNDLHWKDRNHFKGYSISWAETEPLTDEQKYRYFLKLNISGKPMSKEHLNKVNNMLIEEQRKKQ